MPVLVFRFDNDNSVTHRGWCFIALAPGATKCRPLWLCVTRCYRKLDADILLDKTWLHSCSVATDVADWNIFKRQFRRI